VEGDYTRALAESERAARISPNNAELYDTLVSIYSRQGRGPEALAAARKGHELNPRREPLARSFGIQLINARRYDEAEQVLRRALALQPDSLTTQALLAAIPLWTRRSTREWDAWIASVPPPSRTDATFQTLHLQIVAAKGNAAEYVKLVAEYRREDRVGPGYAFALMLTGETDHARTVAARNRDEQLAILARDPTVVDAWSRLAYAYAALGEKSAAIEAIEKSVLPARDSGQSLPEATRALRRAQLLAWVGRKDEAMTELERVWSQPITVARDELSSFMWAPLKGDPRFEAIRNDPRNNVPLY
jgi:tetratricopeptide (TPR) repeat protein